MKKIVQKIFLGVLVCLCCTYPVTLSAHSGRTDSSGGHHDNKNASGLGSYHYHHGYKAHLHPNGVCPYESNLSEEKKNSSSKKTTKNETFSVKNMPSNLTTNQSVTLNYSSTATVSWSSSDSSIISVTQNGVLSAKKEGKATITAKYGSHLKKYKIVVQPIVVTSIKFDNIVEELQVGESVEIKTSISPDNAKNKKITWSSNNKKVATVDQNGKITAVSEGEATITASAYGGKTEKIRLSVCEVNPEEIEVNISKVELPLNSNYTIEATVVPENTTNAKIEWSCENEKIATVKDGVLAGIGEGETIVHVRCQEVYKDIPVKVYVIKASEIKFDLKSLHLQFGKYVAKGTEVIPSIHIQPENTTYDKYTLSSSDQNVIKVVGNKLIAVKKGNAVIRVEKDGVYQEKEIEVYDRGEVFLASLYIAIVGGSELFF